MQEKSLWHNHNYLLLWSGQIISLTGTGISQLALLSAPIEKKVRFGSATIGICWITALLWPLYFVAFQPFTLAIVFASIALVGPIYNVMQYSYRVTLIPDELQGRVNHVRHAVGHSDAFA